MECEMITVSFPSLLGNELRVRFVTMMSGLPGEKIKSTQALN
jgi:hypothetical protein